MERVLVTGVAGFIGFHLAGRLLNEGMDVVGIDSLSDYYDVSLKTDRLKQLEGRKNFTFLKVDIAEREAVEALFARERFDYVVNLAAQAGVRYSVQNPHAYVDANIVGFMNILEGCRHHAVRHLVFASSSSVYGANTRMPFSVRDNVDHPLSLYAATKKANELMAHSYASLYGIPCTGLRFFTVYGAWGRPDTALFLFVRAIMEGRPIDVFNCGRMSRDFTYVDDIVEGLARVLRHLPTPDRAWSGNNPDPSSSYAPYRLYNIGNNNPVELLYLIELIERETGRVAAKNMLPVQPGDVLETCADVDDLVRDVDFKPTTSIEEGVKKFVAWYNDYYRIFERRDTVGQGRKQEAWQGE
jgi:UDP-glucuronate 4-epimerase